MIAAMNNDQVFEATGNEEFPILQKAQVACAQEWALTGIG